MNKILQQQINEVTNKLDEANRTLNDFDAAKKKLTIENAELTRQVKYYQTLTRKVHTQIFPNSMEQFDDVAGIHMVTF